MKNEGVMDFGKSSLGLRVLTVKGSAALLSGLLLFTLSFPISLGAQTKLLNVSYDVTREFYREYNELFSAYWKQQTGETVVINMSHGGSSKQVRSVADGLEADVVTMNQSNDIDLLHDRGNLVPANWQTRLPYHSAPYTSITLFLVRKGNPKHIKDWDDLIAPGISVIIPNPKTSGNGRYSYLAAWGSVVKKGGDQAKAREFVARLFKNVPVLDTGGRGATTTFAQRGIGDVLLTFENEVYLIQKELGAGNFDIVYPRVSILAEPPVSIVDKYADRHKTRPLAEAYLKYLYSEPAQQLAARHHFRPRTTTVSAKQEETFKKLELFTVDEMFGGWKQAQKIHFDDGGFFDQIYSPGK